MQRGEEIKKSYLLNEVICLRQDLLWIVKNMREMESRISNLEALIVVNSKIEKEREKHDE